MVLSPVGGQLVLYTPTIIIHSTLNLLIHLVDWCHVKI